MANKNMRAKLHEDDESSIQEPGGMESNGHTFFEEDYDDDDKTSVSGGADREKDDSDEEKPALPGPEYRIGIRSTSPSRGADSKPPSSSNQRIPKISVHAEESKSPTPDVGVKNQKIQHRTLLSDEEVKRAQEVFALCDTFLEGHLNKDQFAHALAMLGNQFDEKKVKELYQQASSDSLTETAFTDILSKLRQQDDSERNQRVEEAFEALFSGTCKDADRQKDPSGRKFILVKDLRLVLTTYGDRLSDEEADELIRECRPLPGDDGDKTDEGMKQIFFHQYRAMLLDSGL